MTIKEKKELAQILYMTGDVSQKTISERVDISEQSLCKWIKVGEWDNLRQAQLVTKDMLISKIYNEIDGTLNKDDEEIVIGVNGKPKIKKTRKADEIIKLAKSLSYIQNDRLMLPHVLQTFKMFNAFIETLPSAMSAEMIGDIVKGGNIVKVLVKIEQIFLEENSKKLMF
jgi:hypothetical protein